MAAFEKFKANQAKFAIGHAGHKYKARDGHIDPSLSVFNYNYILRDMEFLNSRLQEIGASKRADVNVLAELIVTLPKTFRGDSQDFFDCIFEFARLNYKEQNIVYACVHRDEPTAEEHIHIGFIPTVYDSKKKKATLSYDKCVHRKLDKFHGKLSEYCEKTFGYDVGIINGATKDGNKSIEQLKKETQLKEEIRLLEAQKQQALREAQEALSIGDKIILAKYKEENEKLKKQNYTYSQFIKQNKLVQAFMDWYNKVTGKNKQKEHIK